MPRRTVLVSVLALLVGLLPGSPASAVRNDVVRLAGSTTTATAIAFSQATFDEADTVLVGRDELFADSLASGALQGSTTPLLLTATDALSAGVLAEIERLGATNVVLLGGTEAISDDVEAALSDAGLDVSRREGATRIETAIDVAENLTATTALLVRAFPASAADPTQAFADSIAAGGWAAAEGWPVLFTQTEVLTGSTRDYLADSDITEVVVVGGTSAISEAVTDGLDALGVDWRRVAGPNRFATAVAIAAERGYDSEADAARIILVEGQAEDAWAAGFTAAAHSAVNAAPIVLANGDALPPETEAFLDPPAFAVDEDDVDGPVLTCAADPAACDAAVAALGLPADATITVTSGAIDPGGTATGTFDDGGTPADLEVSGCGIAEGFDVAVTSGTFEFGIAGGQEVDCTLTFTVTFGNGTVQIESASIDVNTPGAGTTLSGQIIGFGADSYTFVTSDGTEVLVEYDADDRFRVQGTESSEAGWEATAMVGNMVEFTDDASADDLDTHNLTTTGQLTEGTIGNVDLANTQYDFVEPFTDSLLRADIDYTDNGDATYRIGGSGATAGEFGDELNEGDEVTITNEGASNERHRVDNGSITGVVTVIDSQAATTRVQIDGRGDDPANAGQDDDFVATAADTFTGDAETHDEFRDELHDGDTLTYSRTGGVETFELDNSAPPTVTGTVTNATDGNNIVTYLVNDGATAATFDHTGAAYREDGAIRVEAEFEAALTPGDTVTYTPDDPNTAANEELVELDNADLAGRPADAQVGADTLDVRNAAGGVIADDLDYTVSPYGGTAVVYFVDDEEVTRDDFETALGTIDSGSTLTAAEIGDGVGVEFRLNV